MLYSSDFTCLATYLEVEVLSTRSIDLVSTFLLKNNSSDAHIGNRFVVFTYGGNYLPLQGTH